MIETETIVKVKKDENFVVKHLSDFYSYQRLKEGRWRQEQLFSFLRQIVKIQPLLEGNQRIGQMASERIEWLGEIQ